MRKAGVIGWPISHSLSPKLFRFWLTRYTLEGEYAPLAVEPKDLAAFARALPEQGYTGANVTIPYKEAILPLLDSIDEIAKIIGAVNTIVIENGKLIGRNTDAYGFMQNLKAQDSLTRKNKAVILGAGGAAKAICKALQDEKFSHIIIANRTIAKAEKLAKQFGASVVEWENRAQALSDADLLVNTTSLGMQNKEPLDIYLEQLPKTAIVTDIVYSPLITPLLAAARARGNKIVDGLGMLLWQAVPGFEAWFGKRPDVDEETRRHVLG
jgi:shikimate dehydrogenase